MMMELAANMAAPTPTHVEVAEDFLKKLNELDAYELDVVDLI